MVFSEFEKTRQASAHNTGFQTNLLSLPSELDLWSQLQLESELYGVEWGKKLFIGKGK